jgi:hypothetical protein
MPDGGIDDSVVAIAAGLLSQGIARGVSDGAIGMQAIRSRINVSKIDEFAGKTREHFDIFDDGVEVIHALQLSCKVEGNLELASLDIEGRVPRSPAWTIEPIELAWPEIDECGIDEDRVRQASDHFAWLQVLGTLLLSRQAPAGCSLYLGKVILILSTSELQQHWITQAGACDQPDRPFQGNAQNPERPVRHSPPRKAST